MYKRLSSKTKVNSPSNYYDFLDDLNQMFDNSVICSNYFKLINNYYNSYLGPLIINKYKVDVKRDHKLDSLLINEISNSSKNDLINQFVVSHYLNMLLDAHEIEMFEMNSGLITSKIKEPFLLKTLSDRYKYIKDYNTNPKNLSNSMLGQSDFKNESTRITLNGFMRRDLVNKIIEGNKHKIVYIDFWAAWCPPCLPEIQYSNRLIQKYAGQNIEFVFICLSDSVIAQQKIQELNTGGKHYFCNSNESIFFQNKYGFKVIPHYLLIDRTGTIVDFGTHLRQSSPMTVEKIDKLLKN
jgi:thiol-disulfide isomerase/thioredoxin